MRKKYNIMEWNNALRQQQNQCLMYNKQPMLSQLVMTKFQQLTFYKLN